MLSKKVTILTSFLFLCFVKRIFSQNKFCSPICSISGCNSNLTNACTACSAPWSWNGTTNKCEIFANSGWALWDSSKDVGGNIDNDLNTIVSCTCTSGCGGGGSWSYSYYGHLSGNNVLTFSDSNGVQIPHYQLRIVFWMILVDDWKDEDTVTVTLEGNYSQTIRRKDRKSFQKVCGNKDNWQDYLRFDKTYNHNTTTGYDITIQTNNSKGSQWGVKQFFVIINYCHAACTSCFGSFVTQCWSCQQNTPMLLSGTTCNQTCLPGYGYTMDGTYCVFCDLKCTVCYEYSYNCTACKSSGTYASFLLSYNFSCEKNCPVGYYGNSTDRTCYLCDPSCVSCKSLPTYCFECQTSLGYAWNSYTCQNPCPKGTFLTSNLTNCTKCSLYCTQCSNTSTNCSVCKLTGIYTAYLLNNTCLPVCPNNFFEDTANGTVNTCKPCDISCLVCTQNPTPCQVCNPGYWLFQEACGSSCPDEYFQDNTTWSCLLCEIWCVQLDMNMYFSNPTSSQIYVDMSFSEDLDFTTFPYQTFQTFTIGSDLYTMDMFVFSYKILSPRSYRIIMEPKGYIFIYNITIKCQTIQYPGNPHMSKNGRPFKITNYVVPRQLLWFLIKAPDMTDLQKQIINGLDKFSGQANDMLTQPYLQQIKKSGIFGFIFSGAQITSCSVLINNIPSQNLYEGVRFWAIFVFFDVPKWQRNSNKTRNVLVPPVQSLIKNSRLLHQDHNRLLFDVNSIQWRFLRTGHSTFFIFDTYGCIFLIIFCWILVLIGYCVNKHKPLLFKRHMGKFFTFVHKVHEISILYIMINTIMEFLYLNLSSFERILSLAFCIIVNIYFLLYQLYIYYDMIKYPSAIIGHPKYDYYAIRYGSLLKNIRYEEYDMKDPWSPKQWFRPYNYHILAYYKKLMMIVSLPLFYHTTHAQIAVLIAIQAAEIARFCFVWPYYRNWRNIFRLILECALLMFFICVLIQGFLVQQIMRNNQQTLLYSIQMFYRFGWIGFAMVFFFNFGFIGLYIYDIIWGCKKSNAQMMDQARRIYYYRKLKAYQQQNHDTPLSLVNKWVKLGNLNKRNFDELSEVNIRVECYRINKISNSQYQVEIKKLVQLYMNIEFNFSKDNNINCGNKFNRKFKLTGQISKQFFDLINEVFFKYWHKDVEEITIKTFQRVDQSLYRPGQKVQLNKNRMNQRIQLLLHSGQTKKINLDNLLQGFPIPNHMLKYLQ